MGSRALSQAARDGKVGSGNNTLVNPFALLRPVCLGMLLAASLEVGGSAVWRQDPYGLVAIGILPGDGGPIATTGFKPNGDVGRALDAFQAGDLAAATAHFVRAILMDPEDVDARCALAGLLLAEQDFEGALGQLIAADRLRPGDAETLYQLAWAHHQLGQGDEATVAAWRSVRRRPGWAPGLVRLGLVRIGAGDVGIIIERRVGVIASQGVRGRNAFPNRRIITGGHDHWPIGTTEPGNRTRDFEFGRIRWRILDNSASFENRVRTA